jgi:hypothetical protein
VYLCDFSVYLCVTKFHMRIFLFLLLIIISPELLCQEANISERISEIAEEIASQGEENGSVDQLSDLLYELSQDPVKINSGYETEISRLFFLTDFQVKILADYVRTTGKILTPFEIANIPGFDRETAEMLIPFITLVQISRSPADSSKIHQSILSNFTRKISAQDTSSLGSQWRILTKYKISYGSFTAGFTTEKDPGEKYLSGSKPVPDFISGFLSFNGTGFVKQIIIGDFSARFGQGTNINTRLMGKLPLTSTGYLSGRNEIRPYTSTDENKYFRGIAAELTFKRIDLNMYISENKIDATMNQDCDSSVTTVRSLYTSGLHNTTLSISKKDILKETDYAIHLSVNHRNTRSGIVLSGTRFSVQIEPDKSAPENLFDFDGATNEVYTFYYNTSLKRSILFGEVSITGKKKYAAIQGMSFRPASRLNLNLFYRYYSPGFVSFRGGGMSQSSSNSNEYGILGNLTFEAARYTFISGGIDLCYYPWLRYRNSSPSMAKRYEIRIKYTPSQKVNIEVLYSSKSSTADGIRENQIPAQSESLSSSIKCSVRYAPNESVSFIAQTGYKTVQPRGGSGFLLLQDVNIKKSGFPVSVWFRYAIYNTASYESGIYTWENDLLNSYSIPVMYGNGSRSYLMISWRLSRKAEIRFKYGITSSIGSDNEIKNVNEVRIQARLNL